MSTSSAAGVSANDSADAGSEHVVGKTYKPTRFMRHPLTRKNQRELDILTGGPPPILKKWKEWEKASQQEQQPEGWNLVEAKWKKVRGRVKKKKEGEADRWIAPVGFSINKVTYGTFPPGDSAHEHGWTTYMNMGVPLIEERSDIQQPPPDVIYENTFVNRTDPRPVTWTAGFEFSVSNAISWSLQGQAQLTFGAKSTASLQQQLQTAMAASESKTTTLKNSRDNEGVDVASQAQATSTTTATATATGTGELSEQLMLGISASVSGSFTTQFKGSFSVSGTVGSRAVVRATQRRKVSKFDYELPITFGGWVALYYEEPVEFDSITAIEGVEDVEARRRAQTRGKTGETPDNPYYQVVARAVDVLELVGDGKEYLTRKGEAEIVSVLAGEAEVFELEKLQLGDGTSDGMDKEAPFYKS
ncbi:gluconolaconase [Streptomyces sp. NPDC048361]|uniref:gluconolaconase n=1 Tax=Streptomyces sp. NPDC048361 TaxID=3154720 RepID=UPI0034121C84